ETRELLPAYEGFDKNQMRKMTHIEYFETRDQYILFDYLEKNPLNSEARYVKIDFSDQKNM
ncbi:MAG: hypothetical protein MJ097_07675, partial [Dorea sp.]|nr:hypothetical protein [Dorea sp.]